MLACVDMSTYNSSPPFGAVDGNSRRSHAPVGLCSVVLLAFDVARAGTIVCQRTLGKGIVFLPISNWGIETSPGRNHDRGRDMFLVQPGKVLASFRRFWVWAGEFSLGGEFSTRESIPRDNNRITTFLPVISKHAGCHPKNAFVRPKRWFGSNEVCDAKEHL